MIAPFIREQAARITWGEPIIEAARSYLGSALGYMKGRDGNVHRGLPAEGYMAPISHLGSTVAFVIGCLFAKRLDGKLPGPVGVAFCGDGTTSTGAFHEAANMANVEQLPLVLVVTNNQFAYSTPNVREFGEASLADRGRGYGFTVHETDGHGLHGYAGSLPHRRQQREGRQGPPVGAGQDPAHVRPRGT